MDSTPRTNATGGKWHAGPDTSEASGIYIWNDGESKLIAQCPTDDCELEEAKANAALLSQALEMFVELRYLAGNCGHCKGTGRWTPPVVPGLPVQPTEDCGMCTRARAILNAACDTSFFED